MVLAMVKDLPAHSRLSASTFDPSALVGTKEGEGEGKKSAPGLEDFDWFHERRTWDRPEMQMAALQATLLGRLVVSLPNWKKNKAPDVDPVGPPEWRHPELREKPKEAASVMDVMRVFGYQGPEEGRSPSVEDAMAVFGFQGEAPN